jgi:hypothetical protein
VARLASSKPSLAVSSRDTLRPMMDAALLARIVGAA